MKIAKSILLPGLILLSLSLFSQSVIQFRGPARNGIYDEKMLLKSWPDEGPPLLWKAEGIGNGYSSPIIAANRIFVTGEIDSIGYLFAYDKAGSLIWKKETGPDWMENFTGSRSTPSLVDSLLYLETSMGKFICVEANTGKTLWLSLIHISEPTRPY